MIINFNYNKSNIPYDVNYFNYFNFKLKIINAFKKIKMAQIEFTYNGINTIIQCLLNEKLKDIIQRFKDKIELNNNKNLIYTYDGKIGINEDLTFEEISNNEDKKRNKMNVLVYDNEFEIRDKDIIKSKNVICPTCKENIKWK